MNDWRWLIEQPEGQFLERKSAYDRSRGHTTPRPLKEALQDVAEALVAMANADGGTVALGIEDDGTVSGVPPSYKLEQAKIQLNDRITPQLRFQAQEVSLQDRRVWVFETDWSPEVHQLSDGRYLLRIGDQSMPFSAKDIEAVKGARRQRTTEMEYISEATLDDLDLSLIQEFAERGKLDGPPEKVLLHYRLAEMANGKFRLTLAALLLFGKDPMRWHPRCGIEFIRWRGVERKTGADLNIEKRLRVEGLSLPRLIERAYERIREQLPERQHLVDLFFQEKLAYPQFAWQEAIVNAVAHRDYRMTGLQIEVHLFDDRLEIWSPGELVEPVTLETLRRRERVHASRNPRIVRILTELGYMRELGEGIPRMFEVMEREWLHPPELRLEGGRFVVTLRSTPIFRPETMQWLKRFKDQGLSRNQVRLLAYAHEHGDRFTSRAYRELVGVDIYIASRDIKDLIRRRLVRLIKPRGRVYEVLSETAGAAVEIPPQFGILLPILHQQGFLKNEDVRRVLGLSRLQAYRLLHRLVDLGLLQPVGRGRGARYESKA